MRERDDGMGCGSLLNEVVEKGRIIKSVTRRWEERSVSAGLSIIGMHEKESPSLRLFNDHIFSSSSPVSPA